MEDIKKTIEVLTSLIKVNKRRMRVYQSLGKKMHNYELRSMFHDNAEQSKNFSSTLSNWHSAFGGFRMHEMKGIDYTLTQMTSLLDLLLQKKVVSKCEEVEQDTLKIYREVMEMSFLPATTAVDIEKQSREFEKSLRKLRYLQEMPGIRANIRYELMHRLAF